MLVSLGFSTAHVPVVALLVSSSVLIASITVMTRTIGGLQGPRFSFRLGRSARRGRSATVQHRALGVRTVTGVRPTLPARPVQIEHVPLRRPARQSGDTPDTQQRGTTHTSATTTAEQTIERLLATEPEVLAGIINDWLRTTEAKTTDRPTHRANDARTKT